MPFLPGLAVVFVGIVDGGHAKVDQQVTTLVRELHVQAKPLPQTAVLALARHTSATTGIVKKLHTSGVISFEVVGGKELHLATYSGEGAVKTYVELSLTGGMLSAEDLATVRDAIADDFGIAVRARGSAPVAPVAAGRAGKSGDDEMPANLGTTQKHAPARAPERTASAVDAGDLTDSQPAPAPVDDTDLQAHAHATGGSPTRAGAALGFGVLARDFSPGPSMIHNYTMSPVGTINATGYVEPIAHVRLTVLGESTLTMHTPFTNGTSAPTSISRWEGAAGYAIRRGNVELVPTLGFGARSFSMDSTVAGRTPDANYDYLSAGLHAAMPLSGRLTVRASALFQPVVGGAQPTAMDLGEASRWAVALGASVELRFTHVFARAGADWQRWAWTWDPTGVPGNNTAVDTYTSGTLSVGANY
jgi:hypothetical protein